MAPTPADLRQAATALRRTAALLDLAVAPLVARAGPETWEGPPADALRAGCVATRARTGGAAAGLRVVAGRLDDRADRLEAEARQRRVRDEEDEARRRQRAELRRQGLPDLHPGAPVPTRTHG